MAGYDSVFLNNTRHRAFYMAYTTGWGRGYLIVEGIGCMNGPGYPVHAVVPFENSNRLRCFSRAGYQPPIVLASGGYMLLDNTTSCAIAPLGMQRSAVQYQHLCALFRIPEVANLFCKSDRL